MENFKDLFDKKIVNHLEKQGIQNPTIVQKQIIPKILKSETSLFFTAKTGSGKTYTFLLPLIKSLKEDINTPQVLIIAPTQDLAVQIFNVARSLCKSADINQPLLATGGTSLKRQIDGLKNKPAIIVGTTNRILMLNKMKKLKLHTITTIVFDECDKMLDKLNIEDTTNLVKKCLRDTRVIFTSASVGNDTLEKAKILKPDTTVIELNNNGLPDKIKHYYIVVDSRKKVEALRTAYHGLDIDRALVFINKDVEITTLSAKLNHHDITTVFIDGEEKSHSRKLALQSFRDKKANLLVASDLASRGLDIKDLQSVINYSLPRTYEQYLHRAGRCGRNNTDGIVVSICDTQEETYIKKFQRKLGIKIIKAEFKEGKLTY